MCCVEREMPKTDAPNFSDETTALSASVAEATRFKGAHGFLRVTQEHIYITKFAVLHAVQN